LFARGLAKAAGSDFNGAIADFTACIDINPDHAGAFLNRAYLLGYEGKLAAALADFNVAIDRLKVHDVTAVCGRAMTHLARGDRPAATRDYEMAIRLAPDDWRPLAGLAGTRLDAGDTTGATAAFAEADRRVPPDERAEFMEIRAHYEAPPE
jgi:tetratricopeptide (TPR) repeat protein